VLTARVSTSRVDGPSTQPVNSASGNRALTRVSLVLLGSVFGVSCVYLGCCRYVLSVP